MVFEVSAQSKKQLKEVFEYAQNKCVAGEALKNAKAAKSDELREVFQGTSRGYAYCFGFLSAMSAFSKNSNPEEEINRIKKSIMVDALYRCDKNSVKEVEVNLDSGLSRASFCAIEINTASSKGNIPINNCYTRIFNDCKPMLEETADIGNFFNAKMSGK